MTGLLIAAAPGILPAEAAKRGGMLSFAVVAEPPNYDCHANTTFGVLHPVAPHYSTLLKYMGDWKDMRIAPDAAESWSSTPDGLTFTFKLRQNVKFHDGSPMTSADVKATYDRIISPPEGVVSARRALYEDISAVETPDPYTIVFRLQGPTPRRSTDSPRRGTASTALPSSRRTRAIPKPRSWGRAPSASWSM